MADAPHQSKVRLLDATLDVVRRRGYAATRVEDICAAAGVTKGSFFHHFDSKDELALAAAARWRENADALFATADFNTIEDPLDRLLGYIDFRKALLQGELAEYTCFAGTVIQESYATHPQLRDACARGMSENVAFLTPIISAAMRKHKIKSSWTAASLAQHTQAVLQGAFILAKAEGQAAVAAESVAHLRRYIELLFAQDINSQVGSRGSAGA
jgi:TetR/AcrR family transcriptional regulator, transcriptional repressor for nem operon